MSDHGNNGNVYVIRPILLPTPQCPQCPTPGLVVSQVRLLDAFLGRPSNAWAQQQLPQLIHQEDQQDPVNKCTKSRATVSVGGEKEEDQLEALYFGSVSRLVRQDPSHRRSTTTA
jgi:hypothetical protein